MLRIGITGGIGSGKSTVTRIFNLLDIPVFISDIESKILLDYDDKIRQKVVDSFGPDILSETGFVDRKKLATLVFSAPDKLQTLNAIMHPSVEQAFLLWANNQKNVPYVLKESAILFESGLHKHMDKNIVVVAPDLLRIKRVMQRDGLSLDEVQKRLNNQMPQSEKQNLANFVIENAEDSMLIPQVIAIHEQILSLNN